MTWDTGWTIQGMISGKDKRLYFLQMVHNGSGAHLVSCRIGIDGSSSRRKAEGREFDYSPPPTAEVKNEWSCISLLPIRLCGVGRDSYIFFYTYTKCYFITFCCVSSNPDSSSMCGLSRNVVQEGSCLNDDKFSSSGDKLLV